MTVGISHHQLKQKDKEREARVDEVNNINFTGQTADQ